MAQIELNIHETWGESLESDFDAFKTELAAAIGKAMDDVGANMQEALARHIETDVYAAYKPRMYVRRYDNGGLVAQARTARIYNHGAGVSIEYKPDGMHPTVPGWNKVHGDDLIGRIEKHDPEYNWLPKKGKKIPNRPFWQNFVDEMVDDGELERLFQDAMANRGITIEIGEGVTKEPNDGHYG